MYIVLERKCFRYYITLFQEEDLIMASAFVIVSFSAVLAAKWAFYARYNKNGR